MTANNYFKIQGTSITLFPFEEMELNSESYLQWMNDREIIKTIGRNDYLLPVSAIKLKDYFQSLNRETVAFFAIYYSESKEKNGNKENMKFVGTLKLYDIDFTSKKASIGILVGDRNVWGKGIATDAISAACKYCFDILKLNKVCAGYIEENMGMAKAFKKNKFSVEGVLKEHFYDLEKFQNVVLVARMKADK